MKQTSLEAYRDLCESGKGKTQRVKILGMILNHPDMTRTELSRAMNIPINAVCGRVNELLESNLLEEGERRPCRFTGKSAFPLKPVEPKEYQEELF